MVDTRSTAAVPGLLEETHKCGSSRRTFKKFSILEWNGTRLREWPRPHARARARHKLVQRTTLVGVGSFMAFPLCAPALILHTRSFGHRGDISNERLNLLFAQS